MRAYFEDQLSIPLSVGTLCYDHWKPYYRYISCEQSLCNAHHLSELQRVFEQDKHAWVERIQILLCTMNVAVKNAGGPVTADQAEGANNFCRDRSYLSTARKQGFSGSQAMASLFKGVQLPFIDAVDHTK